ncbi:hypothetical protein [Nonomuraea sp. NPDC050783]|uniref:hypothetical protein n=1 Tax=Nonomuraea sp. NPDC050783 TaxID=3154634 RepID=UPI00346502D4
MTVIAKSSGALMLAAVVATASSPAWAAPFEAGVTSRTATQSRQSAQAGKLMPGQTLKAGQSVRSRNGQYLLAQQTDGNLVLYQGHKALWSNESAVGPGVTTVMQKDGNLVSYRGGKGIWDTDTSDSPGAWLAVQDDGNLVIYSTEGAPLWSRFASIGRLQSGKSLKAGQMVRSRNGKHVLVQQGDGNLVLYSNDEPMWSSDTASSPGAITVMQKDGNLVVQKDHEALWGSATADSPGAWLAVQDDGNLVIYSTEKVALWSRSFSVGRLQSGRSLTAGQMVTSRNREYKLVQQGDGNLVLLHGQKPLWSSRTASSPGAITVMQKDGNLVVQKDHQVLWNTKTAGSPGAWLGVQDDGNVVVVSADKKALWSTGTAGQ